VEIRGPRLSLVVVLLYLFGALGGLLISTIANRPSPSKTGLIIAHPALLLSGFIFRSDHALWLQAITYLVPNRYFLVVLRGIILKGEGLTTYWPEVGAFAVYGLVVIALASFRLVRQEA
jgi:ABC-2 type transport system permease protein